MKRPVLAEYYSRIDGCVETVAYARRENIDLDLANAHTGVVAVLPCTFDGCGYFDFSDDGSPSCVIEILAEDAETVIDLCAWPLDRPGKFATALGVAPVLGWTQITNPARWAFGNILRIHRRPLDWLRAGCDGVVVLDHLYAPCELSQALGPLLADDAAHARDLKRFLCRPPVSPASILYAEGLAVAA